ncbi:MAG: hypothetical protein KAT05_07565 [Spirochaetes bacterium]|nr:hypothetical protein [Spirochaetota bacterium]
MKDKKNLILLITYFGLVIASPIIFSLIMVLLKIIGLNDFTFCILLFYWTRGFYHTFLNINILFSIILIILEIIVLYLIPIYIYIKKNNKFKVAILGFFILYLVIAVIICVLTYDFILGFGYIMHSIY